MAITDVPAVACAPIDVVELRHKRRESALAQLVAAAERGGAVSEPDVVLAALGRGQRLGVSGTGRGFAVPHARSLAVIKSVMLLGRSPRGIEWGGPGELPARLVLLVLSPGLTPALAHAERVAAAAHALRLQRTRHKLLEADATAVAGLFPGALP